MNIMLRKFYLFIPASLILAFCLFDTAKATEHHPERIVSLGPVITDMICTLNAQDQLVGVTSYCVLPDTSEQKEIIGTVMLMNIEKIISLRPDIVIASALTMQKQITELQRHKINVIKIRNPKTFLEICENFLDIGQLINRNEKAIEIVKKAKFDVDKLKKSVKKLEKRKVFIQIGRRPLKTAAKESFINDYIEFAGGENIAGSTQYNVISREKILQQDPDVIFIATMGSSKKAGAFEKEAWMKFKFLKAFKNHAIHVLDPNIVCSPTPTMFAQGLKIFYHHIHPELNNSDATNKEINYDRNI